PSDFTVVELGTQSRLWLHRTDHSWFPFRISGGWQESEATQRLNNLVNLLGRPDPEWTACLSRLFNDTMADDADKFLSEMRAWTDELKAHLKGDTWEVEIMAQALTEVQKRLDGVKGAFLASTSS